LLVHGSEECEYHETYVYISIKHPNEILKRLEDKLNTLDTIELKIILHILTGKKNLLKRTDSEKEQIKQKDLLNKLILNH